VTLGYPQGLIGPKQSEASGMSSQLYEMRLQIEQKIKADGLDAMDIKGKLALRSGKLLSLITPSMADDQIVVDKLRQAAKEILNLIV
jgi:hypothetical protein